MVLNPKCHIVVSDILVVSDIYPACRSNFNPAGQFGGMIALAVEVGGKKIASEEETFSDLSILIFDHNFQVCQLF